MTQILESKFNIFEEGRTYSGNHRKYILENITSIVTSPATQEGVQLRDFPGFYGHIRRVLAGKTRINEVEVIKFPDGTKMLMENYPCAFTVGLSIDKNGVVSHKQDLMKNEQGKVVQGFIESKKGGWSWAMDGDDGGVFSPTRAKGFAGFDYVWSPGFSANRNYILESAIPDDKTRQVILESICRTAGIDDKKAEAYLDEWKHTSHLQAIALERQLKRYQIYEGTLIEENATLKEKVKAEETRQQAILEGAKNSRIAIPEKVVHAMLNMTTQNDFDTLVSFFESARRVNMNALPLAGNEFNVSQVPMPKNFGKHSEPPKYGEPGYAYNPKTAGYGKLIDGWQE